MVTKPDRPKDPTLRAWLVKIRGLVDPVEVEAEYRSAARHYAKCVVDHLNMLKNVYPHVEWARLKEGRYGNNRQSVR